jgi:hypothetical protein
MIVTRPDGWRYLEYPAVNTAGSQLFEPAGGDARVLRTRG